MRVRYSFSSRRTGTLDTTSRHRKEIPRIVREVIEKSDIVLEVLDARFIDDTRNFTVENMIPKGKQLIFVINKADLTDKNQLKSILDERQLIPYVIISCKDRNGSRKLREELKRKAKRLNIKDRDVMIGVVGYPNTGKSSLINVLTGKTSARTAKEAGFTRGMQKIRLSSGIMILDTPGVIPLYEDSTRKRAALAKHAKISVRTYDKIKDPEFVVHALMQDYPGLLERYYGVDAKGDAEILLAELGKRKKMMVRGGEVDLDRVSRLIIKDWQEARIKPERSYMKTSTQLEAIARFINKFDL